MFCTNCGAKIADGAKFCEKCGKKIGSEIVNSDTEFVEEKQKRENAGNSCQANNYDQDYVQAEAGIKKNIIDSIRDGIFSKITKIRVIRVTGEQLALIFKKYFVDTCDDIDEFDLLDTVPEGNIAGREISKNAMLCHSKGKYRWIKDCDNQVVWELKTSLFDKECFIYRNNVKQILEKKKCEIRGIPYDTSAFVKIKRKGKIPLVILLILIWGIVIWCWLTDGGERSLFSNNEDGSYIAADQSGEDLDSEDLTKQNDSQNTDTIHEDSENSNQSNLETEESDDIAAYDENSETEQYDYMLETADWQLEVVMSYTYSRMGDCELYLNYYDDDGNVVNEKHYGTFGENKEGEGSLEFEDTDETIPYYFDYNENLDTVELVLNIDGEEFRLDEMTAY